jgi:hypothetical protein
MAKQKSEVLKALRDTHLRAIGKVAAQWSALEITILFVISKTLNVSFSDATAVCGSQNASAWCDILKKLTKESKSAGLPENTELDRVCITITKLQTKRNDIVHGYWHPRREMSSGLLGLSLNPNIPSKLASGIGVPKRGTKIFKLIELTPEDMLNTANEIAQAERALFEWHSQRQKRHLLAQAILERQATHQPKRNKLRDLLPPSQALNAPIPSQK